ncbi:flagellar motor protein MotB [Curvibacter sp. CHRR-16]|uniref:flagellar motor protein MotB n=1 Tax=Curvibacter sp. CHRR-16 TaxID=2835872 RepID=UPI001BD9446A|nr:flagellar motor protein MotB [Curvibacter sp. CHRR-16]
MADGKKLQPIIIKRVKKGGHAAHGGAWKIAYADFVTAMMAFFLLMWLLGSTSEGDKKGISDFFQAPIKVALMGGPGAGASSSLIPGGGKDITETVGQCKKTENADKRGRDSEQEKKRSLRAQRDSQNLSKLASKIAASFSNNPKMAEFLSQIRLQITPDGLLIQIVDDQKRPMFDSGSATVKPYMQAILQEIGSALAEVDNRISLDGHTDKAGYANASRGYSNWELSSDRANASRRELIVGGMPLEKIARVVGMGDSQLLEPHDPLAPVNRRISILVMTKEAEERLLGRPVDYAINDTSSNQTAEKKP